MCTCDHLQTQCNFWEWLSSCRRQPEPVAEVQVADVAELADALDSKSGVFTDVGVRAPPSVP